MKLLRLLLPLMILPLSGMDELDEKWLGFVQQLDDQVQSESALKEQFTEILKSNPPSEIVDAGLGKALGKKRRDVVKWNTTLLTPEEYSFGLYKGDIVEVVKTVTDILADNMMRGILLKKRVNLILNSLKEDASEVCHIIEVIESSREKWDQDFLAKPVWQRVFGANLFERVAQANPLINYISEHHQLFGRIPLNTSTMVPLFGHWLYKKASNAVYQRYATTTWPEWFASRLLSYKPNDDGTPKLIKRGPTALVSWSMRLVRFLYNPFSYTAQTSLASLKQTNRILENFSPVKVPAALQGKTAEHAYDFLGVCLGAKVYDKLYARQWTIYAVKHRVALHELLLNYEKALRTGGDLNEAEKDLRSFIERGHRDKGRLPGSMLSSWLQTSREGHTTLATYVQNALIIGIIGKFAWSYYANK